MASASDRTQMLRNTWNQSSRQSQRRNEDEVLVFVQMVSVTSQIYPCSFSQTAKPTEKDIVVLTDTKKDKGKSKAEAMVPAGKHTLSL